MAALASSALLSPAFTVKRSVVIAMAHTIKPHYTNIARKGIKMEHTKALDNGAGGRPAGDYSTISAELLNYAV